LEDIGLGKNYGITLVAIYHRRNNFILPNPDFEINAGDQLLIMGREERIRKLADQGVQIKLIEKGNTLSKRGLTIFELLVAPRSNAIGKTLKILDFRQKYGLSVIALQRGNKTYRTDVGSLKLAIGDSLLVVGELSRQSTMRSSREFLMLEPSSSDQPLVIKDTFISLGVLLGSVIAAVMGVPIYLSLLVATLVLLATGTISMQEVYEAVEWKVVFIVGCMYSVSIAMIQTGLADTAGQWLIHFADITGPLGLAGGAFLISSVLAQIMGGQVAALITGPIAISAAIKYGVNLQAIAVATAIGCSNSFLTPMAHAVNLIMVSPGGYEFKDFFHIGRWLFLISFIGLLIGMVLFWHL
jgi:di/tricarboxylate transporter